MPLLQQHTYACGSDGSEEETPASALYLPFNSQSACNRIFVALIWFLVAQIWVYPSIRIHACFPTGIRKHHLHSIFILGPLFSFLILPQIPTRHKTLTTYNQPHQPPTIETVHIFYSSFLDGCHTFYSWFMRVNVDFVIWSLTSTKRFGHAVCIRLKSRISKQGRCLR